MPAPEPEPGPSSPAVGAPPGVDAQRFGAAIAAIDAANAEDPTVLVVDGVARPKELAHAEAMTEWVRRLDPDADEVQLLAARAHHFRRWTYPRSSEPEGRQGYLRWRLEAKRRQAAAVGELLTGVGYDPDTIDAVRALVTKEGLGRGDLPDVDGRAPAVQTHEDALCLVFLTTQFEPVAEQLGDTKMVAVLSRTLAKMGSRGRAEALGLPLDDHAAALVLAAVERVLPMAPPAPESEAPGPVPSSAPAEGLDLLLATPVDPLLDEVEGSRRGPSPRRWSASHRLRHSPSAEGTDTAPGDTEAAADGSVDATPIPDALVGAATPAAPDDVGVDALHLDDGALDHPALEGVLLDDHDGLEIDPGADPTAVPRASTVRRAMLWGERQHPPPVNAPPPPLPLDAPREPGSVGAVAPDRPAVVASLPRIDARAAGLGEAGVAVGDKPPEPAPKGRRWFGKAASPAADTRPAPPAFEVASPPPPRPVFEEPAAPDAPVEYVVPPEPDTSDQPADPFGIEVAAARMSAGARRAGAVPLGILSTMLREGEVVEAVVQGEYQHHPAVVMLTTRRVLIANERHWSPDLRLVPITPDVVVQGWQDDRRATLLFGAEGRGLVVSGIVDRPLARDLARRLRELVASAGGPQP